MREVAAGPGGVSVDGDLAAAVLVGADGAHSVVRAAAGLSPVRRRALAIRGYAPTHEDGRGLQRIVYGGRRQPSYAWAFDRGDGLSNVGYGELLHPDGAPPSRDLLLDQLQTLVPGRGPPGTTGGPTTCPSRSGAGSSPTDRCCWSATPPGWSTR